MLANRWRSIFDADSGRHCPYTEDQARPCDQDLQQHPNDS